MDTAKSQENESKRNIYIYIYNKHEGKVRLNTFLKPLA